MMKRAFSSLAHRNYKLWFQGQMVSLAGTWMQNTAQAYLAFELTKSPAFLGYVAFANGAPTWIFMLYGGTLVDRYSRRTILIWTQLVMMILAIIMALLTWFQVIEPWHILLLTALLGAANSFDAPARQSFVSELVPKQDMTNAVALNGAMFNTASTVGPALAGIAYALYGPVMCFTINAVSFLAVIIALLRMKLTPIPSKPHHVSVRSQMVEVWRYVASHQLIRSLILIAATMSLFGVSTITIFPSWAVHELAGDARVTGYLQAGRGTGALISSFVVAYFASTMSRGRVMRLGGTILPVALLMFSVMRELHLSLLAIAIMGFAQVLVLNVANALIQTTVDDKFRGRVSSIFGLTFFGLLPLGGLLTGMIAEHWTQTAAVQLSAGLFTISMLLVFTSNRELKLIK